MVVVNHAYYNARLLSRTSTRRFPRVYHHTVVLVNFTATVRPERALHDKSCSCSCSELLRFEEEQSPALPKTSTGHTIVIVDAPLAESQKKSGTVMRSISAPRDDSTRISSNLHRANQLPPRPGGTTAPPLPTRTNPS